MCTWQIIIDPSGQKELYSLESVAIVGGECLFRHTGPQDCSKSILSSLCKRKVQLQLCEIQV